jgi:hypothetical protein
MEDTDSSFGLASLFKVRDIMLHGRLNPSSDGVVRWYMEMFKPFFFGAEDFLEF